MRIPVQHERKQNATGLAHTERLIQLQLLGATACIALAFVAGYAVLPDIIAIPETLADRIAFALQVATAPLLVLLVAIFMVSTARRKSPADVQGSAYGLPSQHLALKAAFLQNTLEQTVLLVGALLILGTLLEGDYLALLPVAAGLFVFGRIAFYVGYRASATNRAFGMGVTMLPAVLGYAWAVIFFIQSLM